MKIFKYQLEVEIVIDEENISKKYPNYKFNYDSIKDFADSLVSKESCEVDIDISKGGLEQYGYSVKKKQTRIK